MPEEQAFCVLVRIMFDYGMRELFKTGFDALHLRFYQLQCLIKVCTFLEYKFSVLRGLDGAFVTIFWKIFYFSFKDYAHELYSHFHEIGIETHM